MNRAWRIQAECWNCYQPVNETNSAPKLGNTTWTKLVQVYRFPWNMPKEPLMSDFLLNFFSSRRQPGVKIIPVATATYYEAEC
jgi:hypothetical protein